MLLGNFISVFHFCCNIVIIGLPEFLYDIGLIGLRLRKFFLIRLIITACSSEQITLLEIKRISLEFLRVSPKNI